MAMWKLYEDGVVIVRRGDKEEEVRTKKSYDKLFFLTPIIVNTYIQDALHTMLIP